MTDAAKLIAETTERDPNNKGAPVRVRWYVSEVAHEELPPAVVADVVGKGPTTTS